MKHNEKQTYHCTHEGCSKTFKKLDGLNKHIKKIHNYDAQFVCQKCSIAFNSQGNLDKHFQSHDKVKVICPTCNKTFATKQNLNRHIKSAHSGEKYFCSYCSKEYAFKDGLDRHLKTCSEHAD